MPDRSLKETVLDASAEAPDTAAARRRWMAVLARASSDDLSRGWDGLAEHPRYRFLRRPEVGLTMVRGRAGGSGTRFNLGEMTVTRCVVETGDGKIGHAYVAGRDVKKAELAAAFDALLQDGDRASGILRLVIEPLAEAQKHRIRERQAKVAATKVDFFTMVRGD